MLVKTQKWSIEKPLLYCTRDGHTTVGVLVQMLLASACVPSPLAEKRGLPGRGNRFETDGTDDRDCLDPSRGLPLVSKRMDPLDFDNRQRQRWPMNDRLSWRVQTRFATDACCVVEWLYRMEESERTNLVKTQSGVLGGTVKGHAGTETISDASMGKPENQ